MKAKEKDIIGIVFNKTWDKARKIALRQAMPTDKEVEAWFADNIGTNCSNSSAIYKFRLWIKDRVKNS